MAVLSLTKHHGLGNDFLVLLDLAGAAPVGADLARALCDRRTGIGADGIIRVTPGAAGADVTMELRNADGSEAEMSGNGIRCLAQAALDAGLVGGARVDVATAAGLRSVEVRSGTDAAGIAVMAVDLGVARVEDAPDEHGVTTARVDLGNPHLVLRDDAGSLDLEKVAAPHPELNVELVAIGGRTAIDMRVWERGAGATQACGTGSGAAAAAAHHWGLVGERVAVRNPGGTLEIELGDTVTLVGPVQYVGRIEVPCH
ncbi:MAG TPA: diaminopimelate epimerase [Acidimicrobiales bacterium]|nr:diaminopimelate epimerase [Acidimicrobiales bacterium]